MLDGPRSARLEISIEENGDVRICLHGTLRAKDVMGVVDELEKLAACVGKPSCIGDCEHHREVLLNAGSKAR